MSNNNLNLISRRLIITIATTVMLGLGTIISGAHAAPRITQPDAEPLILAETEGMDRRQERRDDRQDNREDRRDTRQDCRDEEGVGKDMQTRGSSGASRGRQGLGNNTPAPILVRVALGEGRTSTAHHE